MSRSFSIIKEDTVFSLEPWESGIRATQMNGLAKREQTEKVVCFIAGSQGQLSVSFSLHIEDAQPEVFSHFCIV